MLTLGANELDDETVTNSLEGRIQFILSKNVINGFPNYAKVLKLFLTIPINTASCERSVSALIRLRTYFRTSTGQDRLSTLAIFYIHREKNVDKDHIIKELE